ncbi:Crp/Fnr family transcriptional regulator [Cohnella mopanensis]|uniref:Crp/Fnr family transcriptional regulator n=1 Tax=Cohnella mopanensis TaxID=2911966 RepID=UPI001EF88C4C|nr:Crp/Fnr family transcriptional regulator [Cohnella mopanensis]
MESVRALPKACLVRNSFCFSKGSLEKLKQIMHPHKFNSDIAIFHEGDVADKLFFLYSGRVKVTKFSEEGKEYIMSLYHEGDLFGQLEPFEEPKHQFTALTVEKCEIGIIQKNDLEILLWQYGELSIEFMNWMGYMQRLTQTRMRDLMMYGKQGALCSTLIRLSNSYGLVDNNGLHISLKLTNTELGDYIGCARESVNRMLSELKKADVISVRDGTITIKNLDYLKNLCRCEQCPKELCRI